MSTCILTHIRRCEMHNIPLNCTEYLIGEATVQVSSDGTISDPEDETWTLGGVRETGERLEYFNSFARTGDRFRPRDWAEYFRDYVISGAGELHSKDRVTLRRARIALQTSWPEPKGAQGSAQRV
jgi:hypothetical protein